MKYISPVILESIKSIAVNSGKAFTIADYGCADGGTSMPLMYACVKELRSLHGDELEVHINYEDRPENDYNSLFYFLQGKEKVAVKLLNFNSNTRSNRAQSSSRYFLKPRTSYEFLVTKLFYRFPFRFAPGFV